MKKLIALSLILSASPAFAASGPFFSLRNTDFVVLIAFLIFVGVLLYLKVPATLMGMLAEASAVKEVRDQAVTIAVQVARDVIAKQMTAADANKLIDEAIGQVDAKLH